MTTNLLVGTHIGMSPRWGVQNVTTPEAWPTRDASPTMDLLRRLYLPVAGEIFFSAAGDSRNLNSSESGRSRRVVPDLKAFS